MSKKKKKNKKTKKQNKKLIKKNIIKIKKKSEDLEKKIKENSNLDDISLIQLESALINSTSPVLNQVAIAPEQDTTIILPEERNKTMSSNENSDNEFKYNVSNTKQEETKYVSDKEIQMPEKINPLSLRQQETFLPEQKIEFIHSENINTEQNTIERYFLPEQTDINKLGKETPEQRLDKVDFKKYKTLN